MIQFRDLKRQYSKLRRQINTSILKVNKKTNFISGEDVEILEKKLAQYVGVKHCITCANGTDALTLVLRAWNIKEGDYVIVPNFTFFATAEVVANLGAIPVFVDVDKNTFNIDPKKLEDKISSFLNVDEIRLKAIITVDLFGLPADYDEIEKIANKYGLLLLEDAAQGFGGSINEKKACSFGHAATTSFFPAKPLGCYGDGGAIFTDNDNLASLLRSLRVHGKGEDKYDNIRIGYNSRLDTLQAAILNVKFNAFEKYELRKVNEVAQEYNRLLFNIVATPYIPSGYYSSYAQYTIILESNETRDGLKKYLEKSNIPTFIYYNKPLHRQKAFDSLHISDNNLENSIQLSDRVLSLPMHPYLKNSEIKFISTKVIEFLNK